MSGYGGLMACESCSMPVSCDENGYCYQCRRDPFLFSDPGAVSAKEYEMAQKPLANVAQPTLQVRPRLSAYAENGKYTPLQQLEGQELEIQSTEMIETKYGAALQMNLLDAAGTVHQVCTSAVNIVGAFEAFNEEVENGTQEYPIVAVFKKIALQGGNTCWVIS